MKLFKTMVTALTAGIMCGCAALSTSINRQVTADTIARDYGFTRQTLQTSIFNLTAFSKVQKNGEPLNVYIEGDGFAWASRARISDDPTPFNPVAFELAKSDPASNVVYLARPCQYTPKSEEPHYDSAYWTGKRFSKEVIDSMNEAVDVLIKKAGSREIHLIGYSGGGAVAVLIAAQRQDIASIRTVAGNLDPQGVNRHHRVNLLEGSLDPLDCAEKLALIPQRHFVGTEDKIVPSFIVDNFKKRMGATSCFHVTEVENASHPKGWKERWDELLALPVHC